MKYWAQGAWHDRDEPLPEQLEPAPACKHLNLRLVSWNNCGLPFDCLDCGAKELPWTALNNLLTELNAIVKGR